MPGAKKPESTLRALNDGLASAPLAEASKCAEEVEKADFADIVRETITGSSGDLWLVYLIKGLMSFSYFALFNVLTLYLSDDFGVSDSMAGWIYGGHGVTVGVLSLFGGIIADKLGSRNSLIVGALFLSAAFFLIAWATRIETVVFALFTLKSIGSAITMPALVVAVRRYSTSRNRSLAFSLFYALMNMSAGLSVLGVSICRDHLAGGSHMIGFEGKVSTWRAVASLAFVTAVLQVFASCLLKPSSVETDPSEEVAERRSANVWEIGKQVCSERKFQRFVLLILIFVGVRSIFRHLDVTFPKYFIRSFGVDARFELFLLVNPVCILILAPLATLVIHKLGLSYPACFLLGAWVSGVSPFFLAIESSYAMCLTFILLLTLGEAIWSPKLYEYSVAIAPVGREASYSALSGVPVFLSAGLIGGFSGHAVEMYCPSSQKCCGCMLWVIVGVTAIVSPVGLALLHRVLYDPADLNEEALGGRVTEEDESCVEARPLEAGDSGGSSSNYGATRGTV